MVITELYIKNFGKFKEKHIYLHDGLQVIAGENEYGKSTIHAFIRAMFFGMERGRGRAAARDDYSRYEPWDNPLYYAGVMRFVCGGKNFRLERSFSAQNRTAVLVCEDDGEELSVEQGDLSILLGDITRGLFDSTVSVGQLRVMPGQELSDALENYAVNCLETGNGEYDLSGALRILEEKQKEILRNLRAEEELQETRRGRLLQECTYLEQDMQNLREEYAGKEQQLKDLENRPSEISGKKHEEPAEEQPQEYGRTLARGGAVGILVGIVGMLWGRFSGSMGGVSEQTITIIAVLILLLAVISLAVGTVVSGKEKAARRAALRDRRRKKEKQDNIEETELMENKRRIGWEMERVRSEWKEKEIRCENIKEQYNEFPQNDLQKRLEIRSRAIALAQSQMKKAAHDTGKMTEQLLERKASEIFGEITFNRYKGLKVDQKNGIAVWDGEKRIPAERLSRGTIEQIYFAVRMAAADILQEETLPVILDETFAFYDDKRLKSALKWLSGQKKQVIIFTCHKREEEIIEKEEFR